MARRSTLPTHPSTLPAVSSPVLGLHLRALRVLAIVAITSGQDTKAVSPAIHDDSKATTTESASALPVCVHGMVKRYVPFTFLAIRRSYQEQHTHL